MIASRRPKDRDFLETVEGLVFCVVDYLHPPDRVTAYLKYSPAQSGRWQKSGTAYHRELAFYHAHQVSQTLDYLQAHHPDYVDYCPVRDMRFSLIPHDRVATYYCPESRLAEVLAHPADPLEEELAQVAENVVAAAGVPLADLGVTGSILLGMHDPAFSDLNVTVYGREAMRRLREALTGAGIPGIEPLGPPFTDTWRRQIADNHGLSKAQVDWLMTRRWNYVYSRYAGRQRYLCFQAVRTDDEIRERYGDHSYRTAGSCRLRALVSDAGEAIYMPAVYQVERVRILDGPEVEVRQVRTHEGLFGQVADAGQEIEAQGRLERIDGGPLYRLVVGSSSREGREYVLPVGV